LWEWLRQDDIEVPTVHLVGYPVYLNPQEVAMYDIDKLDDGWAVIQTTAVGETRVVENLTGLDFDDADDYADLLNLMFCPDGETVH
jgi:hypothetical protein